VYSSDRTCYVRFIKVVWVSSRWSSFQREGWPGARFMADRTVICVRVTPLHRQHQSSEHGAWERYPSTMRWRPHHPSCLRYRGDTLREKEELVEDRAKSLLTRRPTRAEIDIRPHRSVALLLLPQPCAHHPPFLPHFNEDVVSRLDGKILGTFHTRRLALENIPGGPSMQHQQRRQLGISLPRVRCTRSRRH
jgi:hypothetical protein